MLETVAMPLVTGDLTEACSISALAELAGACFVLYVGYSVISMLNKSFEARKKYAEQKESNEAYLDKYVRSYQIALIKKQSEAEGLDNLEEIMQTFPKADFMDGIREDLSNKMKDQ